MTMNGESGGMNIAVHEIPGQPVLLSVRSLRALGAVIDFANDHMILTRVCRNKVIPLERASSGHQLFPLSDDPYKHAKHRSSSFVSLLADEPDSARE